MQRYTIVNGIPGRQFAVLDQRSECWSALRLAVQMRGKASLQPPESVYGGVSAGIRVGETLFEPTQCARTDARKYRALRIGAAQELFNSPIFPQHEHISC